MGKPKLSHVLSLLIMAMPCATVGALTTSEGAIVPEELFSGLEYSMVGPSRGGRVTTVAGHKDRPATFFMGASGGGVWKTEDGGLTWNNVSDGSFATGSIGAIRTAESNPGRPSGSVKWVGGLRNTERASTAPGAGRSSRANGGPRPARTIESTFS